MRHRTAVQSVVFQVLSYVTEELCIQQVTTVGVCVVILWMWADHTKPFVLPVVKLSDATDITEWIRGVGRHLSSSFHKQFNIVMRLE